MPFSAHISTFITRKKPDSSTRRTIIDLTRPEGQSINNGVQNDSYLGTSWELHYPYVDDLIGRLNVFGPAAFLRLISAGPLDNFRIDPGDFNLLALPHRGKYYLDLSLVFGFRTGSNFFQKTSDAVRFIIIKLGLAKY